MRFSHELKKKHEASQLPPSLHRVNNTRRDTTLKSFSKCFRPSFFRPARKEPPREARSQPRGF